MRPVAFVLVGVAALGSAAAAAASPEQLLAEGNGRYEQGDFVGAIDAYRTLLEQEIEDAAVYYNLGCALARQARYGSAVLAYRRALWLEPAHDEARANLEWVRARLADLPAASFSVRDLLARLAAIVPLRAGLVIALVAEWAGVGLIAVSLMTRLSASRARRARAVGLGLVVVALAAGGAPLTQLYLRSTEPRAVVLSARAEAHSGPDASNPVLFTAHEGYEVTLRGHRDGWARISAPGGLAGWIPEASVGPIRPPRGPAAAAPFAPIVPGG
ncbi:MAG: hypothetical protein JSV80_14405 [Acidobacteriota bacterium]|nr:MAG: hypothetical protein JSV80_14405 [Acidobacteriota bacterium]